MDWQDRQAGSDLVNDGDVVTRSETRAWDSLGRPEAVTNDLGAFSHSYTGSLPRPETITGPNGLVTAFTYFPNDATQARAQLLAGINHTRGEAALSQHTYDYDAACRITIWQQERDSALAATWAFGYNAADELTSAQQTGASSLLLDEQQWAYDATGNWLSHLVGNAMQTRTHNDLNQLTVTGGAGQTAVEVTVNEFARVTVDGHRAAISGDPATGYYFRRKITVAPGQNTVAIAATDLDNNVTAKNWQFTVPEAGMPLTYDANGNLLTEGGRTFTWDFENRLTSVTGAFGTVAWEYDAFDRRVRQTDTPVSGTPKVRTLIWEGMNIIESRSQTATTNEVRRYYGRGEEREVAGVGSTRLYYATDHLGSIRELVDSVGNVRARYDYDPYGKVTKLSGDVDTDFAYTGHFYHAASGLHMAPYRAYDSQLGRWLSTDPIEEVGGANLYGYVSNDPANFVDFLGLTPEEVQNCSLPIEPGSTPL